MMNMFSNFLSYITAPLYTLVSSPTWFFSAPGKIFGFSVPWRVGAFTGLSLSAIVSVVVFLQYFYSGLFGTDVLFVAIDRPLNLLLVAFLVLAFSIVIGLATHYWLMDVPSRFPMIDNAWKRGISELQVAGIELVDLPLFLVTGVPDTPSASALMQASGLKIGIKPPENESQPLLWFTAERDGEHAIFLFLSTCCQTSLMSGGRGLEKEKVSAGVRSNEAPRGTFVDAGNSLDLGALQSMPLARGHSPQASLVSLDPNSDFDHDRSVSEPAPREMGGQRSPRGPQQTLDDSEESSVPASPQPITSVQRLTNKSAQIAQDELQHVCRLLRTGRQPFCPMNAVMSTVPFSMLKADNGGRGKTLGEVTRNDMTILTKELGLRAHVVAVVHGLEVDEDFRIFVKRMREFQSAADVDRRLGKGLSPWAEGTETGREMIEDVAVCSCDAFQRLIYKFFSSTQSLKKVDNGQLYRFLANIRGRIETNVSGWLVDGFAENDENDRRSRDVNRLPYFAGCYFVAAQPQSSGINDEERLFAHVPGVFERLFELEGEIEWTEEATAKDSNYRNAANVVFLMTLAGIVTIVVGLFRFLGNTSPA